MTDTNTGTETRQPLLESLSTKLVGELKVYIQRHRGQVSDMIAAAKEKSGRQASACYARAVDGLICALFQAAQTALQVRGDSGSPLAIAAVGSYARNSLSLYSDLDVRVLVGGAPERAGPLVEALLYPLWDVGLAIGHQVVSEESVLELARSDLPTATSLLDWRLLVGDRDINERFQERLFDTVFNTERVGEFLQQLNEAAESRKERFGGSVFLLEPEVKNGAGGQRDLDLAHWAARARWRCRSLQELVAVGVLLPDEWSEVLEAIEFVTRVRNLLHHRAGRRVDRLAFVEQEAIAELLGYGGDGPGVEHFMSDYYRHARSIERTSEMILRRAEPPPKQRATAVALGRGIVRIGDSVAFADADLLFTEPELVLAIYEEAVKRNLAVDERSRRAVMRAAAGETFAQRLRGSQAAALSFRRLVTHCGACRFKYGSILTELHEVGLLLAMIPEFSPVVGRVHHDIYHVYTVDVHSIAAVDMLRALFRGEKLADNQFAHDLTKQIRHPDALFFATLLHDVGKDEGGRDHAERGAVLAEAILGRLHLSDPEVAAVQRLIRNHLNMYLVATRRDLDDPRTLEAFTDKVKNGRGLRDLYLLTLCDVATTSPGTLNPWKRRMLDELYQAALFWLSEGAIRRADVAESGEAIAGLLPSGKLSPFAESFLGSIPARYLAANDPPWVVKHLKLAEEVQGQRAALRLLQVDGPHSEVAIVADSHAGTLAQIAAVLSKNRLRVVGAQIYSWTAAGGRERTLDLFWVQSSANVERLLPEMEKDLEEVMARNADGAQLVREKGYDARWSHRPAPAVPLQIRIKNHVASEHTIVEVVTKDRADLLFWTSTAIHAVGASIDLAKIHTEGARVTDVFYIRNAVGQKFSDGPESDVLRDQIRTTLKGMTGGVEEACP